MQINVNDLQINIKNKLDNYISFLKEGNTLQDSILEMYIPSTEEFTQINKEVTDSLIDINENNSIGVNKDNIAFVYFFKNSFLVEDINKKFLKIKDIIKSNLNILFTEFFKEYLKPSINVFHIEKNPEASFNSPNLIGIYVSFQGSKILNNIVGDLNYGYVVGITTNMQYTLETKKLKGTICCILEIIEKAFKNENLTKNDIIHMYELYMHQFIS